MAETEAPAGQATAPAPTSNGQSAPSGQATASGSAPESTEETFFDPRDIEHSPELKAAYKSMQGKFTKTMQKLKAEQRKIEEYDKYSKNPQQALQELARRHGYRLLQGQPDAADTQWNPKSWEDVLTEAESRVMQKLDPVFNELKTVKQSNIESYMDRQHPDWREYEDAMMDILSRHPSMAGDLDTLYRMALPEEVAQARATKEALRRIKGETDSAAVSGGSSTSKPITDEPTGKLSFDQAVAVARARLEKAGLRPPGR